MDLETNYHDAKAIILEIDPSKAIYLKYAELFISSGFDKLPWYLALRKLLKLMNANDVPARSLFIVIAIMIIEFYCKDFDISNFLCGTRNILELHAKVKRIFAQHYND